MLADRDGSVRVEALPLNPTPDPMRVALAAEPVSSSNVFLFHKTTRREVYERARAARPDLDAVLLWNEREEITEATEANLIVEIDGRRVTPPIECGVLPGVLRAELLQVDEIEEGIVRRGDLPRASRIWLISSLRGWMRARLVK
jgi:para-aminobenzoate synthetase/4-amino-4-deoxychorismate lyase